MLTSISQENRSIKFTSFIQIDISPFDNGIDLSTLILLFKEELFKKEPRFDDNKDFPGRSVSEIEFKKSILLIKLILVFL